MLSCDRDRKVEVLVIVAEDGPIQPILLPYPSLHVPLSTTGQTRPFTPTPDICQPRAIIRPHWRLLLHVVHLPAYPFCILEIAARAGLTVIHTDDPKPTHAPTQGQLESGQRNNLDRLMIKLEGIG
ncbi:hypothetical protein HAX54_043042, partial [Datura stramonium]|nr:hypothetical protein [Datura stramonium]